MIRRMLAFVLAALAGPALAQSGARLPSPQYPIQYVAHEVIGDGSTPNGGTPPSYALRPPAFAETVDPRPWISDGGVSYHPLAGQTKTLLESKARFRCVDAKIGVYDAIRGPGQEPFGHGHNFFGNRAASKDSDYTSLRRNPDSSCSGGVLNGSAYWSQWVWKADAMSPGQPLVKKWDLMDLYYVTADCYANEGSGVDYTSPNRCQPIPRGFQTVFGFNMDDDWRGFRAYVARWSAKHPALGVMAVDGSQGTWKCEASNGSYAGSPWPGSAEQPYLANADGSEALRCPAHETIINSITMPTCWDGRLSAPDGFGNLRPAVRYSSDGRLHCPNHWYRLPSVRVFFRYSHLGPADYRTWRCSSDPAASAAMGRPMKPCESTHTDYQFGWHEKTSDTWQRLCLGITVDGRPGTPAGCDYSTIGPTQRLISDSPPPGSHEPLVPQTLRFTGTKPGDWFVPTENQRAMLIGHAGTAH